MQPDPFDAEPRITQTPLKHFTNREGFIKDFFRYVDGPAEQPLAVLVFYGVGGIGKTALVRKLAADLHDTTLLCPHARVDLETVRDRTQADRDVLLKMRAQLGRQFGISFPRFELCLAVLVARDGGDPEPLVQVNPWLGHVLHLVMDIGQLPGQSAVGPARRLFRKFPKLEQMVRRAGGTEEVTRLQKQNDQGLTEELLRCFARDLNENLLPRAGSSCRCVLFLDTYEALWRGREAAASSQAGLVDEWVRSLAKYCVASGILLVINGRDRLAWAEDDPGWDEHLRQHLMGGLSYHDAQAFLATCGVGPLFEREATILQDAIIRCCNTENRPDAEVSCHPLYLALCAEIVINTRKAEGSEPTSDVFRAVPNERVASELAARFLRSLQNAGMEQWVVELSLTPRFDEAAALALDAARQHHNGRAGWEELKHFSFIEPDLDGFFRLHKTMREALRPRAADDRKRDIHRWFQEHWSGRQVQALAWFHRWSLDPEPVLEEWESLHDAALKERRIAEARTLLGWWSHIALDDTDRQSMGGNLWARTHRSLGRRLYATPMAPRQGALTVSIQHYQDALLVYSEEDLPQEWARTQHNLGAAYFALPSGDPAENLARAIACYEAALRVSTDQDFPQDWAMTQNNLGNAYFKLPSGDQAGNLARAIACYQAALRVRTEQDFPQGWATTQNNLGNAYASLPSGDRADNLARAIACYQAALRVSTEQHFPQQWATIQNNLGNAYRNLPSGDRAGNLARAIACYQAALRVRTEQDFPQGWATTQNNLGNAYASLPSGDRADNLARAIACYQAALRVSTEQHFPQQWATIQWNLGLTLFDLSQQGKEASVLQRAREALAAAKRGFEKVGLSEDAAQLVSLMATIEDDPTGQ